MSLAVFPKKQPNQVRYIIFLFILFTSCIADQTVSLQEDKIVNEHFDEGEIKHFDRILSFFDNEVQFLTGEKESLENSYKKFFKMIEDSTEAGKQSSTISKIRSDKLNQLVSSLPENFKNQIWGVYYSVNSSSGDSVVTFDIKPNGKYAEFLKFSAKENQLIQNYYDAFEQAGALTPSMYSGMIKNYNQVQINKERERLIVAIHYIALRYTAELRGYSN